MSLALACAILVLDGDTVRICGETIRLIGIDAPELHGCRKGRTCAKGDPRRSAATLRRLAKRKPVIIRRFGHDRYARTLALVSAGGVDMSCWQITHNAAIYVPRWDPQKKLARACRAVKTP